MSDERQEKKIVIDEDWKSKVEAERAAERSGERASQEAAGQGAGEQGAGPQNAAPQGPAMPLPPPSLLFLVDSLSYRAMIALGMLPNPMSQQSSPQLDQAKHAIDLLEMLFEKTAGNRTDEETEAMEAILHQLRMAYVAYRG